MFQRHSHNKYLHRKAIKLLNYPHLSLLFIFWLGGTLSSIFGGMLCQELNLGLFQTHCGKYENALKNIWKGTKTGIISRNTADKVIGSRSRRNEETWKWPRSVSKLYWAGMTKNQVFLPLVEAQSEWSCLHCSMSWAYILHPWPISSAIKWKYQISLSQKEVNDNEISVNISRF